MANIKDNIPVKQLLASVRAFDSPLYVYDGDKIKKQYNDFISAFDVPSLKVNYATKALSNINILKLMHQLGSHLDAVSIQEIRLGLHAGFTPDQILFTPNGVSISELQAAVKLGVNINIDHIETLEYFGHHHPDIPICIRVNPHVMAGGNANISVGHIDSKFGISIHQLPLVHRLVASLNLQINGIHMHTGSDILDVEVFLRAADILFEAAKGFDSLEYIDFGSGFKVAYRPGDISTDINRFGKAISRRFKEFTKEYGRPLTLVFEPGKYMVSEAGYFLVRSNIIKQTTSTVFVGVDSGFNHLIRPMLYNAHHEISNLSNPKGNPRIYTVVGYICETDTFGVNRILPEVSPGDVLCFHNAGAYCFSMSSNYNSRYRPAEVLLLDGQMHLIREREQFEDLLQGQVPVL